MAKTSSETTANNSAKVASRQSLLPLCNFVVNIKALQEVGTQKFSGALVLKFLEKIFPSTKELNYRISPLRGNTESDPDNNCEFYLKGKPYWFLFSALDESTTQLFLNKFTTLSQRGNPIAINNGAFQVESVISPPNINKNIPEHNQDNFSRPEQIKWIRGNGYQPLLDKIIPKNQLTLNFVSPTVLCHQAQNYLFPEPRLLFRDLKETWLVNNNPESIIDLSKPLFKKIQVHEYDLQTKQVELQQQRITGFRGKCRLDFSTFSDEVKTKLNALARLGFYAGVGEHTESGFGQFCI